MHTLMPGGGWGGGSFGWCGNNCSITVMSWLTHTHTHTLMSGGGERERARNGGRLDSQACKSNVGNLIS